MLSFRRLVDSAACVPSFGMPTEPGLSTVTLWVVGAHRIGNFSVLCAFKRVHTAAASTDHSSTLLYARAKDVTMVKKVVNCLPSLDLIKQDICNQ